MLTLNVLTALLAPGVLSSVLPARDLHARDLDTAGALQSILNNIGTNGSAVSGASAGIVVASPSKTDPDCESIPPQIGMKVTNSC